MGFTLKIYPVFGVHYNMNSYPREKWDTKTPTELFVELYGPQVARKLGLVEVEFKSLCLRPDLVK